MELKIETRTPLWTGGVDGKVDRIHETGIIGSLRWWFEALVRGVGGRACGATNGKCKELNVKVYKTRLEAGIDEQQALADAGLCPVCRLFGATNWAKMFSLYVSDAQTGLARPFDLKHDSFKCTQGSRYFFPEGHKGIITFVAHPRRPGDIETLRLVAGLFDFIQRNAALGAKTNLGYGVFQWVKPPEELPSPVEFATLVARQAAVKFDSTHRETGIWPNLQDMFLAEANIGKWSAKEFVDFKYELREIFRNDPRIVAMISDQGQRSNLRHFLLGSTWVEPNEASKIKMAVIDDRLRIWGWIPRQWDEGTFGAAKRGEIERILFKVVEEKVKKVYRWRTVRRFKGTDTIEFLRWMMEGKTDES